MIIHEIHMDLVNRGTPCRIDAVQGEQGSRSIRAYLYAAGQPWVVPDDVVVSLRYRKPNNKSGSYSNREDGSAAWTADGNSLTISIEKQALNVSGVVTADIVLSKANYILATFPILIYASPSPSGEADSSDDSAGGDGGSSDGLSDKEKEIILTLFKNVAYKTSDMSAKVAELEALWGGSGGGDTPPEDTTDPIEKYTVTNNLTNVTNSNTQTEVSSTDGYYSATLTVADGYSMQSVVITMGGVDITADVYGDGGILITEVTGDIVITAVAGVALAYALAEPLAFPGSGNAVYDTGYAMYPNGTKDVSVCIDFDNTSSPWAAIILATANVTDGYKLHHTGNRKWRVHSNAADAETTATMPLENYRMVYIQPKSDAFAIYVLVDDVVTKLTGTTFAYYPEASENTVTLGTDNTSFVGAINDFRVYDQILSDGQIEAYLRGGAI